MSLPTTELYKYTYEEEAKDSSLKSQSSVQQSQDCGQVS
jgi:hypothetical protein